MELKDKVKNASLIFLFIFLGCAVLTVIYAFVGDENTARRFIDMAFFSFGATFLVGLIIFFISCKDFLLKPPPSKRRVEKAPGAIWKVGRAAPASEDEPTNIESVDRMPGNWIGGAIIMGSLVWWGVAYLIYARILA